MNKKTHPFWETKSLDELDLDEWEALCDRCGACCLLKIEDIDTGEIRNTTISCKYLDTVECICMVYEGRLEADPDCIKLTPHNIHQITWLPDTCAYKLVYEGKKLKCWHPLISGDPESVHRAGISIRDKVVPGRFVHPDEIEILKA
jgi:uncharacterized protein